MGVKVGTTVALGNSYFEVVEGAPVGAIIFSVVGVVGVCVGVIVVLSQVISCAMSATIKSPLVITPQECCKGIDKNKTSLLQIPCREPCVNLSDCDVSKKDVDKTSVTPNDCNDLWNCHR